MKGEYGDWCRLRVEIWETKDDEEGRGRDVLRIDWRAQRTLKEQC